MKVLGVTLSNLNKAVGLSTRRGSRQPPAETGAVVRGQIHRKICESCEDLILSEEKQDVTETGE